MTRTMRRKDRAMPTADAMELLKKVEYGFLSTIDGENQPYVVPISYVLLDGTIYLHCAQQGHKLDNIKTNPQVCFSVVGETLPVYDKDFTTYFESVIVFGKAEIVTEEHEKITALMALAQRYLPAHMGKAPDAIKKSFSRTCVIRINIEHITGKAKRKKA